MTENVLLSINEIMKMTGRSRRTIIRWFEREPGTIVVIDNPERMHKRRHRTLRIPRTLFQRVMEAKKLCCFVLLTYLLGRW
jgi:transposase